MKKKLLALLLAFLMITSTFLLSACEVNTKPKEVSQYSITGLKNSYEVDEEVDYDNLYIIIDYQDGSSSTIKVERDWIIEEVDTSSAGEKRISIKYNDVTIPKTINIIAPVNYKAMLTEFYSNLTASNVSSVDVKVTLDAMANLFGETSSVNKWFEGNINREDLNISAWPQSYLTDDEFNYYDIYTAFCEQMFKYYYDTIIDEILAESIEYVNGQNRISDLNMDLSAPELLEAIFDILTNDDKYQESLAKVVKSKVSNVVTLIYDSLINQTNLFYSYEEHKVPDVVKQTVRSFVNKYVRDFANQYNIDVEEFATDVFELIDSYGNLSNNAIVNATDKALVKLVYNLVFDDAHAPVDIILSSIDELIDELEDMESEEVSDDMDFALNIVVNAHVSFLRSLRNAVTFCADIDDITSIYSIIKSLENNFGIVNLLRSISFGNRIQYIDDDDDGIVDRTENVDILLFNETTLDNIQGLIDDYIENGELDQEVFMIHLITELLVQYNRAFLYVEMYAREYEYDYELGEWTETIYVVGKTDYEPAIRLVSDLALILLEQYRSGEITLLSSLYSILLESELADAPELDASIQELITKIEELPFECNLNNGEFTAEILADLLDVTVEALTEYQSEISGYLSQMLALLSVNAEYMPRIQAKMNNYHEYDEQWEEECATLWEEYQDALSEYYDAINPVVDYYIGKFIDGDFDFEAFVMDLLDVYESKNSSIYGYVSLGAAFVLNVMGYDNDLTETVPEIVKMMYDIVASTFADDVTLADKLEDLIDKFAGFFDFANRDNEEYFAEFVDLLSDTVVYFGRENFEVLSEVFTYLTDLYTYNMLYSCFNGVFGLYDDVESYTQIIELPFGQEGYHPSLVLYFANVNVHDAVKGVVDTYLDKLLDKEAFDVKEFTSNVIEAIIEEDEFIGNIDKVLYGSLFGLCDCNDSEIILAVYNKLAEPYLATEYQKINECIKEVCDSLDQWLFNKDSIENVLSDLSDATIEVLQEFKYYVAYLFAYPITDLLVDRSYYDNLQSIRWQECEQVYEAYESCNASYEDYISAYNRYLQVWSERAQFLDNYRQAFIQTFEYYIDKICDGEFVLYDLLNDVIRILEDNENEYASVLKTIVIVAQIYGNLNNPDFDYNELFSDVELPPQIEGIDYNVLINKYAEEGAFNDIISIADMGNEYVLNDANEVIAQIITIDISLNFDLLLVSTSAHLNIELQLNF